MLDSGWLFVTKMSFSVWFVSLYVFVIGVIAQTYDNETYTDSVTFVPDFEMVTFPQVTLNAHTYPVYENYSGLEPEYYELTTLKAMNVIPTFEDVDDYLSRPEAVQFLTRFHSKIHKEMIREQLRSCPFTYLCGFSLNIPAFQQIRSCCGSCSCDFPSCFDTQTCCPDVIPSSFFDDFNSAYPDALYAEFRNLKRCTLLHAKYDPAFKHYSIHMYATCPEGSDKYLERKCTQLYSYDTVSSMSDMLPVETPVDGIYRKMPRS